MLTHEIWHLLLLLEIILVIPTPCFDEVIEDELYTPAGLFVDFVDDGKDLFLLRARNETFACVVNGTESHARDAAYV